MVDVHFRTNRLLNRENEASRVLDNRQFILAVLDTRKLLCQ